MAKSVVAQWANWMNDNIKGKYCIAFWTKTLSIHVRIKAKARCIIICICRKYLMWTYMVLQCIKNSGREHLSCQQWLFLGRVLEGFCSLFSFFCCSLFSILLCNWILDTRWNTYIIRKFKKSRHYCVTLRSKLLEGWKWNPNYKFNFRQCSDLHLHIFLLGKPIKLGQPGTLYRQKDTDVVQRLKTWNTSHRGKKNYFNHKKGFSGINKELP